MKAQEYALVILAAGIGSRFGGGVKQLKQVGPSGEIIMDYSIHDAIQAGFRKIVFIIRKDIEEDFREVIGSRMEALCRPLGVEIAYAFQELEDLPAAYACPAERKKPWGTGHALLACRDVLREPFVVINADDYYGKKAFGILLEFLRQLPENSRGRYCMAGFRLGNTLSDYGGVTRGICMTDGLGNLRQVRETRNIVKTPGGAAAGTGEPLDLNSCVSMNMWGFTPDILPVLEERFQDFLAENLREPQSEFLLPVLIDRMLAENAASVQMLPTDDQWFGMTFREDIPAVVEAFRELVRQGVYEAGLYDDL